MSNVGQLTAYVASAFAWSCGCSLLAPVVKPKLSAAPGVLFFSVPLACGCVDDDFGGDSRCLAFNLP